VNALTGERLSGMIAGSREKCKAVAASDPEKLAEIDKTLDLTFEEHFKFQELQAQNHAAGVLTTEAAQIVYASLGESMSSSNGGWTAGVDTATKFIVTQLMGELLKLDLKRRGVNV
jgi:hypothetical protein